MIIRNLPEETHRALKMRASQKGVSTEAEIRAILDEAVRPPVRLNIGTELATFGRKFGGMDIDFSRNSAPTEAADFE